MEMSTKSQIHLWIYNHPFYGISDQIDFFVSTFRQHGYTVSVGSQPSKVSLNVVIENFSGETRDILIRFCQSSRKRVAVIMTEHLDFDGGQILIHGDPLWNDNDYMHPATQVGRIVNLMECISYIRCFFVLGDLPELRNMSAMLPGVDVRVIPFPKVDLVADFKDGHASSVANDLFFSGYVTEYRSNIYSILNKCEFSIAWPKKFVSRKKRNELNRKSKIILNIPQRSDWRWLSLMRIVAALRCGRASVSLGTKDESRIASCCEQLDISDEQWPELLKEHIEDWQAVYHRCYENYMTMAGDFEREKGFPHDLLEYWAITDGLHH